MIVNILLRYFWQHDSFMTYLTQKYECHHFLQMQVIVTSGSNYEKNGGWFSDLSAIFFATISL